MITIDEQALASELMQRLYQARNALELLYGHTVNISYDAMEEQAARLAARLIGKGGAESAAATAVSLLNSRTIPAAEQDGRAFWSTHLGRACVHWTGAAGSVARLRMVAEEAFGLSRQHVGELIKLGALELDEEIGGVTPSSLQREAEKRFHVQTEEMADAARARS